MADPPNGQMDTEPRRPLLARCERREPPAHPSQWPSQRPHRHGDHRTEMHFRPACASPAAVACPARELAWPSAGPPLTYFAQLGWWGVPLGCTIPSALGLMYYIYLGPIESPNKGLETAVAVPTGSLGVGGGLPLRRKGDCPFLGPRVTIRSATLHRLPQALHHQGPVRGL